MAIKIWMREVTDFAGYDVAFYDFDTSNWDMFMWTNAWNRKKLPKWKIPLRTFRLSYEQADIMYKKMKEIYEK
jgi:hypothetical protein